MMAFILNGQLLWNNRDVRESKPEPRLSSVLLASNLPGTLSAAHNVIRTGWEISSSQAAKQDMLPPDLLVGICGLNKLASIYLKLLDSAVLGKNTIV